MSDEHDTEGQFAGESDDPAEIEYVETVRLHVAVPLELVAQTNADAQDLYEAAKYRFIKYVDAYEDEYGCSAWLDLTDHRPLDQRYPTVAEASKRLEHLINALDLPSDEIDALNDALQAYDLAVSEIG